MLAGTVPYDIRDLKIFRKTGDTYGEAIDVAGIQSLNVSVEGSADDSYGDGGIYTTIVTDRTASGELTTAGINAAAFAGLSGGSVVSAGTGNTAVTHLNISAELNLPFVQIMGLVPVGSADGGVIQVTLYLARINSGPDFTFSRDIPSYSFGYTAQSGPSNTFMTVSHWADGTKALPTTAMTALPTA